MGKTLGAFEQLILYAVVALGEEAYGAAIRREIVDRTHREVSAGAVYTVLERLESSSLITSRVGEPTAERGGRRRKHYDIRPDGARLLVASRDRMRRMEKGLDGILDRLATSEEGA